MIKTLCNSEAAEELFRDENANWSRAGAYALVEYLEQLEGDTGTPIEFDRVAIRCDFSEFSGLQEWAIEYFGGLSKAVEEFGDDASGFSDGDCDDDIREYINDHGTLIEFEGGVIVSSF